MLEIFAKSTLQLVSSLFGRVGVSAVFIRKLFGGKDYLFPDKEVARPMKFDSNEDLLLPSRPRQ